jgi:hypothetical protein
MYSSEVVINNSGHEFLGDFMPDLPDNVILNKVITGCGMTQLCLSNKVKYVLAVPYVAIIKNKKKWCEDKDIEVCAVHGGGASEDDLIVYTGDKIITTYDSLELVTDTLDKKGVLKEWKICIDEAHKLVDSASFRPRAIKNVLNNYERYKSYVFGTATPIRDKYQLPELRGIKKARIEWDANFVKPFQILYHMYPKRINDVVTVIAMKYLTGEIQPNAHFFINSVKSITLIISKLRELGYTDHLKVKIVCAQNARNVNTINEKLPSEYGISRTEEVSRKINFYTATSFEGCDIKDEDGQSYIIVDGAKDFTKINIATILPQITGRIRDSKHKNVVELIYSSNAMFTKVSENEYERTIKKHLDDAQVEVNLLNQLPDNASTRKKWKHDNDNIYISYEDENFIVNENAMYNEMYNFRTIHRTYCTGKNGIREGTKEYNGTEYIFSKSWGEDTSRLSVSKPKASQKPSFKRLVNTYQKYNLILKSDSTSKKSKKFKRERLKASATTATYDNLYPFVGKAIHTLGFEKIEKLGFRQSAVKKEMLIADAMVSSSSKIVSILKLRTGQWISRSEAKSKIQNIYKDLSINKAAKATDLNEWYTTKEDNRPIDGKKTTGFSIISCNIKAVKV